MDYFLRFIILSGLYFITGKLGLLMAVPPGYATAVWPPSGFALGGLLLFGYRYWPAVLFGSFLVNIWTSLNTTDPSAFMNGLRPAVQIALGASVQALAGAWLIKRTLGKDEILLIKEKDVFKFLVLGGPVSCLIAASVGVATLISTGAIKQDSALFSWWTWWVGDSIGVIIFAPLMMMVLSKSSVIWRSRLLSVGLPMVGCFALTTILFVFMKTTENRRIHEVFENQGQLLTRTLESNMQRHLDVLYSLQSFFNSSQSVERSEFASFTNNILSRYESFTALEWDPVITREQRETFEQSIRAEGFLDFAIKEKSETNELKIASQREIYFPITYAEPFESNKTVMGFDFMSEKSRQDAVKLAWESGNLAMTKPIQLIQGPKGVIAFLAIYKNGNSAASIDERKKNLLGFVVVVFKIKDIMQSIFHQQEYQDLVLFVDDVDPKEGEVNVYAQNREFIPSEHGKEKTLRDSFHGFEFVEKIVLGGRVWQIEAYPTSDYFISQQNWSMWFILAGGLLFVGILGGFLLVITGREYLINIVVAERTAELNQVNHKLNLEITQKQEIEKSLKLHNKELEQFNDAVLGREERVIELKKEINRLSIELGQKPPYDLHFLN